MLDTVTIIGALGAVLFGALSRVASSRVLYRDQEGDGVSLRSICRYLALIFLVILAANLVRRLKG